MKFKRLSVLLTHMLAFSTFFTTFVFAEENIDKPNLVALGDSITFGYKLEDNQTDSPSPNAFPSLIAPGEFDVTNLGENGWTSSELLNAMITDAKFSTAIKSADIITLDIGSNDLLDAVGVSQIIANPTGLDQAALLQKVIPAANLLKQNLTAIITKIKTDNPLAPIILYNIYNPFGESIDPTFALLHTLGKQIIHDGVQNVPVYGTVPGINQLYTAADQIPGIYLADAYTAFNGKQVDYIFGLPKDLIHPDAEGHQALAKLGRDILLSLLMEEITFEVKQTSTEETTESVTIEVLPGNQKVSTMRWLEGTLTVKDFVDKDGKETGSNITNNKFDVSKNGTYTVYIMDNFGRESVKTIEVKNIKDKTPVVDSPTTPVVNTPAPVTSTPAPTPQVKATGYAIPNTASPAFNFVAFGSVVLLAGFVTLQVQRRRRQDA